jgi:hypothetical protein
MQARELNRLGATRIFAVRRRDGQWFQERAMVVGFHWQTSGRAWCRSSRYASKWPRSLAEQVAREHGGTAVEVSGQVTCAPLGRTRRGSPADPTVERHRHRRPGQPVRGDAGVAEHGRVERSR